MVNSSEYTISGSNAQSTNTNSPLYLNTEQQVFHPTNTMWIKKKKKEKEKIQIIPIKSTPFFTTLIILKDETKQVSNIGFIMVHGLNESHIAPCDMRPT